MEELSKLPTQSPNGAGCTAARCRELLLRRQRHGSSEFAIATVEKRPPIKKKVFLHLVPLCSQSIPRLIPGSVAKIKKKKILDILFNQLGAEVLRIMSKSQWVRKFQKNYNDIHPKTKHNVLCSRNICKIKNFSDDFQYFIEKAGCGCFACTKHSVVYQVKCVIVCSHN